MPMFCLRGESLTNRSVQAMSSFAAEAHAAARKARKAAEVASRELGGGRDLYDASPRAATAALASPRQVINTPRSSLKATYIPSLGEIDRAGRTAMEARRMVEKMLTRLEHESVSDGIERAVSMLPEKAQKSPQVKRVTPRRAQTTKQSGAATSPRMATKDNPKFDALLSNAADELRRRDAALGPTHPGTLERLHTVGALLAAGGRLDEAEDNLDRAVRLRREALGPAHPKTLQSAKALEDVRRTKSGDIPPPTVTLRLAVSSKEPQSPRVKISCD